MRGKAGVQQPFEIRVANGVELAVARRGTGRPVLCLTATGHGGRDFDAFSELATAQRFEIVLIDWPGHGSSPDQPDDFQVSAKSYSDLLESLIPQIWPDGIAPIVVGNSIGGAAAIQLTARRPDLIRALVLCNPGGLAPLNWIGRIYIGRMVRFFERGAAGAPSFPRAFARYYRRVLRATPAIPQRDRIVAAGPEMASILAQAWDSFQSPAADLRREIATIKCPILFAWARSDWVVSWPASRRAATTAPDHRVALFTGGHSAFLEDPVAFFSCFTSFTSELEDQPNGR